MLKFVDGTKTGDIANIQEDRPILHRDLESLEKWRLHETGDSILINVELYTQGKKYRV